MKYSRSRDHPLLFYVYFLNEQIQTGGKQKNVWNKQE